MFWKMHMRKHLRFRWDLDDPCEFTNFSNPDLAEELPETVSFCSQEKRVSDFEKSLVIPHGVGSIDSYFTQFVM